jgi:hypothetical protein
MLRCGVNCSKTGLSPSSTHRTFWTGELAQKATFRELRNYFRFASDTSAIRRWCSAYSWIHAAQWRFGNKGGSPPSAVTFFWKNYSRRNVTAGSSRLARRPGIATAARAGRARRSKDALSTGTEAAPVWKNWARKRKPVNTAQMRPKAIPPRIQRDSC